MRDTFMKKENRDREFFAMPPEQRRQFRRRSGGPHLLHPMYVDDYEEETGRKLTEDEKGFGNTIYRTHFAKLYFIEKKLG